MSIQWFPGHMNSTRYAIKERMKAGLDVVIELLDARLPGSSRNPLLAQLTQGKPTLKLLNKQDLADPARTAEWLAHYNALPDAGDAINTAGVSTFWYNTQSHSLAMFLHNYLVERLGRPSDGVYWNNLALTRPTVAPAVLLELGYLSNPRDEAQLRDPEWRAGAIRSVMSAISAFASSHGANRERGNTVG